MTDGYNNKHAGSAILDALLVAFWLMSSTWKATTHIILGRTLNTENQCSL